MTTAVIPLGLRAAWRRNLTQPYLAYVILLGWCRKNLKNENSKAACAGWGGLDLIGGEPVKHEGVLVVGAMPHEWLFPRCCAAVHHGGAGTTAASTAAGLPTAVVPFFGDQSFWGAMCKCA